MKWLDQIKVMTGICLLVMVGNWVGFGVDPLQAVPGMLWLGLMVLAGIATSKVCPVKVPPVAVIAIYGVLLTMPSFPLASHINHHVAQVNFLALTTPILAYVGISIGKDLDAFRKLGPRIVIISVLVFTGTFLGSAIIAHWVLSWTGQIPTGTPLGNP